MPNSTFQRSFATLNLALNDSFLFYSRHTQKYLNVAKWHFAGGQFQLKINTFPEGLALSRSFLD
ncbi:MAG: hypothetical protein D0528_01280 [Methylococcales bacterium]|nr:MAG: hypothetical protein D0528_01280 [Methylococcales bacterium]